VRQPMTSSETMTQLRALSEFFKLHPIKYIKLLIDREYRRVINADLEKQTY